MDIASCFSVFRTEDVYNDATLMMYVFERNTPRRSGIVDQEPGQKLRQVREKLRLRYRDVEEASHRIAHYKGNDDFLIGLSRLADIENKGTVPTMYRLYSLCAIYGIDFAGALQWYGIDILDLPADSARVGLEQTRLLHLDGAVEVNLDLPKIEDNVDLRNTSYISRQAQRWGKLPLALLSSIDLQRGRYAFIGLDDWSMHPILPPGSFLQIDATKTKIVGGGSWSSEYERPIYFLERRKGYQCGWCTERDGMLIVQTHFGSSSGPELLRYPGEVEIIGQVVAVAMRLDAGKRRHTRS